MGTVCNTVFDQLEALILISGSCSQSISHECSNNPLTGTSWWIDRTNTKRQYCHGTQLNSTTKGCQCSLNGSECTTGVLNKKVLINLNCLICIINGDNFLILVMIFSQFGGQFLELPKMGTDLEVLLLITYVLDQMQL